MVLILLMAIVASVFSISEKPPMKPEKRVVVLLHGLARSGASMRTMQLALEEEGFETCNVEYPSTKHRIETLAREHILPGSKNVLALKGLGSIL